MSRIIVSLLVIVLLSVGAVGCLGSDGGEEAQKIAGDIILTIEDFPSGWERVESTYFSEDNLDIINMTSHATGRFELMNSDLPSAVDIVIAAYDSGFFASSVYDNLSQTFSFLAENIKPLSVGDEGFISKYNSETGLWNSAWAAFRTNNVLVMCLAIYDPDDGITENWLMDIMELQESRI